MIGHLTKKMRDCIILYDAQVLPLATFMADGWRGVPATEGKKPFQGDSVEIEVPWSIPVEM